MNNGNLRVKNIKACGKNNIFILRYKIKRQKLFNYVVNPLISISTQKNKKRMIAPRIELGTFCVLDRCDNHYTMRSSSKQFLNLVFEGLHHLNFMMIHEKHTFNVKYFVVSYKAHNTVHNNIE